MITYFSTFISGFAPIVEEILPTSLPNCTISTLLDGLVVYRTSAHIERIKQLGLFNNTFLLISRLSETGKRDTNRVVQKLAADLDLSDVAPVLPEKKKGTFRIRVSKENELTKLDRSITHSIEAKVMRQTYLSVNPLKADYEFWFIIRREGEAFCGVRVTGLNGSSESAQAGELRPQLARFLSVLSQPNDHDIVLDPFAGYGAIPYQRALCGEYKQIIAGDLDSTLLPKLTEKLGQLPQVEVRSLNALKLDGIAAHTVTTIITDPPWGKYTMQTVDMNVFYAEMLRSFKRVLITNGRVVVLTAEKEALRKCSVAAGFTVIKELDILVSGKKAGVFCLTVTEAGAR